MAARLLYKSMLRTARELQLDGKTLKLQASADPAMWGHGKPHTRNVSLRSLFPSLKTEVSGEALNGAELAEVVRSEFRAQQHIDAVEDSLVDEGFAALRILHQQIALQGCTSDTVTEGVRVEATSGFIPESSNPDAGHFLFTYCITISNTGSNVVRLLGRQWDIVDESGELVAQVPKGSQGVVGHTPILNPGRRKLPILERGSLANCERSHARELSDGSVQRE